MNFLRIGILFATAAFLAGCGEKISAVGEDKSFYIAKVEAWGPPPKESSDAQLKDLRDQTTLLAGHVPHTQNPYLLRLRITKFHQKNPAMSLIVGDQNLLEVSGEILTLDGKTPIATFSTTATNDAYVNGLLGFVVSAAASTNEVVHRLDGEAANGILGQVYGTKQWNVWTKGH